MSRGLDLDQGLVVAAHGRHFLVETPEGRRLICHPRGKKSDCVVGDRVRWQPAGDEGVIEHLEPRRNLLFRQDEWRTKSFAANLDQLLVLVAGEPMFSESQLTRALIAAESAGIPARIALNKTDLPTAAAARERLRPYRAMGVEVLELSLLSQPPVTQYRDSPPGGPATVFGTAGRQSLTVDRAASLAALQPLLAQRTTLVLGPSGTGKSTLINAVVPAAQAAVGEISQALNSGRHTTTSTRWYWIDAARSSALIDSPGFQEFGLRHIEAPQLALLMPDLKPHAGECRFYNCSHRQEPGCGIRAAVERADISTSRYRIYQELYDELTEKRW